MLYKYKIGFYIQFYLNILHFFLSTRISENTTYISNSNEAATGKNLKIKINTSFGP